MGTLRFLFSLTLVLAICWAGHPIPDRVEPNTLEIQANLEDYKLPSGIKPTNYKIELEPHLNDSNVDDKKKFTFDGKSTITIKVEKATKSIKFHAKDLNFNEKSTVLKLAKNDKIVENVITHKPDKEKDFMELQLSKEIANETYTLTLQYAGILNDKLNGFYRSSYVNEHNDKIWLATTHFEPVGARLAFPCWDEPNIKAKFDITIKHLPNYNATLSNMDISKSEKVGDKQVTTFKTTPDMSTYLVAFVVSNYDKKSNKDNDFRVWTKPQALNSTTYALEIGETILKELEEFTKIKYKDQGMTKMDQITIPDLSPGAMENWGLVTYRETSLLYTEKVTTTQTKQNIAAVISHEFCHQWFGNLVTVDWWKYIWLNEGFATFFQYYTTEKVMLKKEEPWRMLDQFVVKILQGSAFVTDASIKSRPMNSDAVTPAQIKNLFDDISYRKAASVIRMMQHFLTEKLFQEGLQEYLFKNKFKSATSKTLFKAISDKIPKDSKLLPYSLEFIMENWVEKSGYPVVTVTRNYTTNEASLEQERFFLVKPVQKDTTQWYVPINYVVEESPEITSAEAANWLEPNKQFLLKNLNATQWLLLNNNQTGYYRVNYDDTNWRFLSNYLKSDKFTKLNPVSRAQLIDDAFNLARAGKVDYNVALHISVYLSKETDYIPWYAAARAIEHLDVVLQNAKNYDVFHKYIAQRLEGFVKAIDLKAEPNKNDTHSMKLSKELGLAMACKYGVKECEDFAKEKLEKWLKDKDNQFPPDLRTAILCAGLRNADETTWNMTLERYISSSDKAERTAIMDGLGCIKSEKIVNKFLALTLEEKPVVDIFSVMNSISVGNAASFDILMKFIYENAEKVRAADKENNLLIPYFNRLANRITTFDQLGKLTVFIERQQLQRDQKFTGVATARENLDWIELYRDKVIKWMEENLDKKKPNSANSISFTSLLVIIPVLLARLY